MSAWFRLCLLLALSSSSHAFVVRNELSHGSLSLLSAESSNDEKPPVVSRTVFLAGLLAAPAVVHATSEKPSNALQESISGMVAGASLTVTKTLVKYPLDTATVRLQMPQSDYSIREPFRLFQGSYRGVLSPLLANIPAGAVFFAVKDACKASLKGNTDLGRVAVTALAVAAAQVPYWVVRNPSEVVKTRQQANLPGYDTTPWEAYRQVWKDDKAFYQGYLENILYAYPADVLKFVCYDQLVGTATVSPLEGALAGALATAIAQFFTTPLDVVRNRVMTSKSASTGYVDSLVALARDEGTAGLLAGWAPRVGKALLSGAIQFATYEETKQMMAQLLQR